jgi:hypothetical protein
MPRISVKRMAQVALLTFAAGEISAAAADVLVLQTVGPRAPRHYRVGTRHADNAVFELRPGDSMTVLARGGTRQWRGPGFYSVVAPPRPLVLANGQTVRVQTGVVRGELPRPGMQPTEVWEYDASKEGRLCVPAGTTPHLWRPLSNAAAAVTIRASNGVSRRVEWAPGTYRMPWPAALPLTSGASYVIEQGGGQPTIRVTPVALTTGASETQALATLLLARGCSAQLQTLIATRFDPTAPVVTPPTTRSGRPWML